MHAGVVTHMWTHSPQMILKMRMLSHTNQCLSIKKLAGMYCKFYRSDEHTYERVNYSSPELKTELTHQNGMVKLVRALSVSRFTKCLMS